MSPDHGDWRMSAACLDQDPELFFPVGDGDKALLQLHRAKQVCGSCVVSELCLTWARQVNIEHGVWGGHGEDERRSMKRRLQRRSAVSG